MYHLAKTIISWRRHLYTMYIESDKGLFISNYSFELINNDSCFKRRYEFITTDDYKSLGNTMETRGEIIMYSADTTEQMDEYLQKLMIQLELEK